MTDEQLIYNLLRDRKPRSIINIMQVLKPGCINWACRSRISDLNKKLISDGTGEIVNLSKGNELAVYQFIPKEKPLEIKFEGNQGAFL